MMSNLWVIVALAFAAQVGANSIGAPTAACIEMTPYHGPNVGQEGPSPYTLAAVKDGEHVAVTISCNVDAYFKGFLLQARNASDVIVGTFMEPSDPLAAVISCTEGLSDAVTHTSSVNKTSLTLHWVPPSPPQDVNFTLTVVQSYEIFWVKQQLEYTNAANLNMQNSAWIVLCVVYHFIAT